MNCLNLLFLINNYKKMLKIIIPIIFFFTTDVLIAQDQDSIVREVKYTFEQWCPLYILENYCSQSGLPIIMKKLNTDERVRSIKPWPNSAEPDQPSNTLVEYNNVKISFENWRKDGTGSLHTFCIFFRTPNELDQFFMLYALFMGLEKDPENPNRYYWPDGSMNAVTKTSHPKDNLFFATCFVWQPTYCR